MQTVETENFEFFLLKNIDFSLWGNHETTQTHFELLHAYLKD